MKLPVYVFLSPYASVGIDNLNDAKPGDLIITNYRAMSEDYIFVGESEFEFDFRKKSEVAADMVKAIKEAKEKLVNDHAIKLKKINDQLSKMLAISYEA